MFDQIRAVTYTPATRNLTRVLHQSEQKTSFTITFLFRECLIYYVVTFPYSRLCAHHWRETLLLQHVHIIARFPSEQALKVIGPCKTNDAPSRALLAVAVRGKRAP